MSLPNEPASSQDHILSFVNRYNELMGVRDSTDKLIEDTLLYCQGLERALQQETGRLENELHKSQLRLAEVLASRRDLEKQLSSYESQINSLYKENDTYKFQDSLIRQGAEGGKKAAQALRSSVARQWTDKGQETRIVAKVVANSAGLARTLNSHEFRDFAVGFSQAHTAFDFVDVGGGRERRAEPKIRDNTLWHLQNGNCRQIFLGVGHDAGYATFLDDLFHADPAARDRISIIEGAAGNTADLKATGAGTIRLDKELFRSERLVERTSAYAVAATGRTASPSDSVASSGGAAGATSSTTFSYASAITNGTPPPTMSIPLAPSSKPSPRPARTNPGAVGSSSSTPSRAGSPQFQKIPPQQPDWNPGPRGLDEPIVVNVAVMEAVKRRKDTDKLCNNHFLRGPCAKGDGCNFVHDYKPNSEEIHAIAVLARQNPCTHGQDCENWELPEY
ncbi:CCCH zinc finger DNA binding protein [Cordyceps fumosorosea ARSEF 2679]|uniref:CCCH zinc finger DNA binding protein n=1 Tax=Cordyceps fumosorosea (strain ARSEF 2679) TaxID=1081104 RepID=A0A167MZF0_CORFA|nr:CCCH zinc finger DNA binding protein [Cordyceps fumosorosea ARSEF 2679]OAA54943.1 CCCH zinc finger DNA binding protein [Cordyceps fumosorosea ARSEF 2679]